MRREGVIFLLENSTDFLFSLDQAFRHGHLTNPLRVARYGNEAILYLKGVGIYADRSHYPLPSLIIIDLAMPDGSGMAVLGWIRQQAEFEHVPVIILVESLQGNNVQEALNLGADSFCIKREALKSLVQKVKSLDVHRKNSLPTIALR